MTGPGPFRVLGKRGPRPCAHPGSLDPEVSHMTVTLVPPLAARLARTAPADPTPGPLDVLGVPGQINLDYAATAPCVRAAADAVAELLTWYASVHRGAGALSRRCTLAYERARQTVGDFFGARADDHVVFTRNTTDALNLLARALPAGTTVVTFGGEHHANLLPWPRGSVRLPSPSCAGAARPTATDRRCWSR